MKKALAWCRKYSLWILGGVLTLIGIILAVNYERDKITQLKVDKKIEKTKEETAKLQGARDEVLEHEAELGERDEELSVSVAALDEKIEGLVEERRVVEEASNEPRTAEQVSNGFNKRYRGKSSDV